MPAELTLGIDQDGRVSVEISGCPGINDDDDFYEYTFHYPMKFFHTEGLFERQHYGLKTVRDHPRDAHMIVTAEEGEEPYLEINLDDGSAVFTHCFDRSVIQHFIAHIQANVGKTFTNEHAKTYRLHAVPGEPVGHTAPAAGGRRLQKKKKARTTKRKTKRRATRKIRR
jgi:hypothetical protein